MGLIRASCGLVLLTLAAAPGYFGIFILSKAFADYQDSPDSTYIAASLPPLILSAICVLLALQVMFGLRQIKRRAGEILRPWHSSE